MSKASRITLAACVVCAFTALGIFLATRDWSLPPSANQAPSSGQPAPVAVPMQIPPVVTSPPPIVQEKVYDESAEQMARVYSENELRGDDWYKGKRYRITGRVSDVGKDFMGAAYVTLDGGSGFIQCMFGSPDGLSTIDKGEEVTINGRVSGRSLGVVVVRDCSLE